MSETSQSAIERLIDDKDFQAGLHSNPGLKHQLEADADLARTELSSLRLANERLRGEVASIEAAEQSRWQERIYKVCCRDTAELGTQIDGKGCDSGDPLDFSISEIEQAIHAWIDCAADQRQQSLAQAAVSIDAACANRDALIHSLRSSLASAELDKVTTEWAIPLLRGCRLALEEISLGRGPFNRDPLKHAENTVEAMKEIAKTTISEIDAAMAKAKGWK